MLFNGLGSRVFLRQSGAVELFIAVRTTFKQLRGSSQLQSVYLQAGAHHHVNAANGFDYLSPPEACSLSYVTA